MPDRDSHLDDNGFVVLDIDSSGIAPHSHRAQIAACALCDPDGYRGSTICDHQDHREAARRGMELVRAELVKAKGGKA